MRVRTDSLLGATLFGVVLILIGSLISLVASYQSTRIMVDSGLFDPERLASGDDQIILEAISSAMRSSTTASLISCLLWLLATIGAGVLYVVLHKRQDPEMSVGVQGGAYTGALANAIGYLLNGILSVIIFIPLFTDIMDQFNTAFSAPGAPPMPANLGGVWIASFAFGTLCGILLAAGFGALMGAAGGAIGGAFIK